MDRDERKSLLAGHFLLGHLPDQDLDRLCDHIFTYSYQADETIFLKGEPATAMMAVVSGQVRICSISEQGKEIILNIIGPREVFGEIALLDGGERTANATAMEPTELFILERRHFFPLLERNPEFCIKLINVLCGRLRQTSEQVEDMTFLDLRRRLAKRLIGLSRANGGENRDGTGARIDLPQRDLGEMIGVTREAVNKQLREWEAMGLVRLGRENLTVLDVAGLEEISKSLS